MLPKKSAIQLTLIPVQDYMDLRIGRIRRTFPLKPHTFKSGSNGYLVSTQFKTVEGKKYRVNLQLKEFNDKTYYYWRRAHEQ